MRGLLLACMVGACTTMEAEAPAAPITPVLQRYASERDFSGVTLVVAANGVREFEDARGLADRNLRLEVTRDTRFQIASISKLFVAVAVLREVDRGQLRLDAPVGAYVPHLPPLLSRITIASLMGHTSGLRRDSNFNADESLTVAEHVARLTDEELQLPAGQYGYSNTGYVLLARAVEIASGRPFDVALREEVMAPAGLTDTDFIVGDNAIPRLAVGYARGPEGWRTPPRARHLGVYPPGGLYSTADDLVRLMELLARGRLLSEQSRAQWRGLSAGRRVSRRWQGGIDARNARRPDDRHSVQCRRRADYGNASRRSNRRRRGLTRASCAVPTTGYGLLPRPDWSIRLHRNGIGAR